jgi:hypothetical protein
LPCLLSRRVLNNVLKVVKDTLDYVHDPCPVCASLSSSFSLACEGLDELLAFIRVDHMNHKSAHGVVKNAVAAVLRLEQGRVMEPADADRPLAHFFALRRFPQWMQRERPSP